MGRVTLRRLLAVAFVAFLFVACAGAEADTWQQVQERGVMVVGMDASYPPFEYVDESGAIVGFDVDLARALGERLGLEVSFVNISYDGLYDSLLLGNVDVLISALVVAPEFAGRAKFSEPYFNMGEHLLVPVGSSIETMDDLDGQTLAVEFGSGGDVEARQWERRLAELEVLRAASPGEAAEAVLNDEADAALVDGISARLAVGQHPDLRLGDNVVDVLIAAAAHPDNGGELISRINDALREMIADGTLDDLIEVWFGPQR